MSTIITGNFSTKARADAAIDVLLVNGIPSDHICTFALNAPGQHAAFPIGGDHDASVGAEHAGRGAAAGAAIGGVVGASAGLIAVAAAGPAAVAGGAAVGAYLGSLAGALSTLGDDEAAPSVQEHEAAHAGVLLAVDAPAPFEQQRVTDILYREGAREVEPAQGTWRDGTWIDYQPVKTDSLPETVTLKQHP